MTPAQQIKEHAGGLGFDAIGIAGLAPLDAPAHFEAWLAAGRQGEMAYLATPRSRERRADPNRVLPDLKAVVCVALCHSPTREHEIDRRLGRVARYAAGEDYHRVMRDKLRALGDFVSGLLPQATTLWYSDTGAILERGWAERAGIGWTGKHSGLISPKLGSWFLLGELLIDQTLDPDPPFSKDHCGTCSRCISACPTGAIVAPHQVDARLCISYLTIELRGAIPVELRRLIGDWIFGCDICQEACPWNRFAPPAREARLHARSLDGWTLEKFLTLDPSGFATLFAQSPIRRARRSGFLRNVCVALGNRGEGNAAPALARTLESDPDALVRAHAAWALGEIACRLAGAGQTSGSLGQIAAALQRAAGGDSSSMVRMEARQALAVHSSGSPVSFAPSTHSAPPSA